MTNKKDLTGQKFGRLTVLKESKKRKNGSVIWICQCECGNLKNVPAPYLTRGCTSSCGCLQKEKRGKRNRTHKKDLIGMKFGRLTVLRNSGKEKHRTTIWVCLCMCGNLTEVMEHSLTRGRTKSCGCLYKETRRRDLTDKRFGRLTVLGDSGKREGHGSVIWVCRCDCGNIKEISSRLLTTGHAKSCGCLQRERVGEINFKHGYSHGDRLYNIWNGIKDRCRNPNKKTYKFYGGKGIKICKEWQDDFLSFRKWALNSGYKDDLTIDRIDNDGNYEPNNCQWLTLKENTDKARAIRYGKNPKKEESQDEQL